MFMILCRCRLYGCVIDIWDRLTHEAIVLILDWYDSKWKGFVAFVQQHY